MAQSERKANRLAKNPSPYLQQHGFNPVDWYPWGPEALETAKREDKPIFLSVGYSTCHWCHVMAHESFENASIADLMNKNFISIKVDREARPDIDEFYMTAVQAMSGVGGWPLSVFMTPEGKPFYGGTYFPPDEGMGRPGFRRVLETIATAWKNQKKELLESAWAIDRAITSHLDTEQVGGAGPDKAAIEQAYLRLSGSFDEAHGGFGAAPKFPTPSYIEFLLSYWYRTGHEKALRMAAKTFDSLAAGGITDQIGGGVHRYATDRGWLTPHFEKMLYDQALIASCALHLFQVTRNGHYAEFAREIFEYVLRDLGADAGGFYSAEDADSEGKEGKFYVWDAKEIDSILGKADGAVFNYYYGVTKEGNFEGANILHLNAMLMDLEERFDLDPDTAINLIEKCRRKLFEARRLRMRPGRDEKVIACWNALMISALALGGTVLNEPAYVGAAKKAMKFVYENLYVNGKLSRFWRDGKAFENGLLEDYAAMALALLGLYEATFEVEWLGRAKALVGQMCELFEDESQGGFFMAERDGGGLIANQKPIYDGALASGNSMAVLAMARLAHLTGDVQLINKCRRTLNSFANQINENPTAMGYMLLSFELIEGASRQVIICGDRDKAGQMIKYIHRQYVPDTVVALKDNGEIDEFIPFAKDMKPAGEKPSVFICSNYTCQEPITKFDEFKAAISENLLGNSMRK